MNLLSGCGGITQKCIKSVNLKNRDGTSRMVHGLLKCQTCSKLWNRDVNGAINILQIAKCELSGNPRPAQFCRTKNNSTNSSNEY